MDLPVAIPELVFTMEVVKQQRNCTGTPCRTAAIAVSSPAAPVDDQEGRPPQATRDQIVEHSTPGRGGFAAHGLDREQHLPAVRAHASDHEQRDRRGLDVSFQ